MRSDDGKTSLKKPKLLFELKIWKTIDTIW